MKLMQERCHFFEIGDVKSFTKAVKEALAAGALFRVAPFHDSSLALLCFTSARRWSL